MSRKRLFQDIVAAIGDIASVEDPRTGWPGIAVFRQGGESYRVALHVGPVGLSQRRRDDTERRFQNPGQQRPLVQIEGAESYLVGFWTGDRLVAASKPVVVVMEATDRRFERDTRQSYFVSLAHLEEAAETGWSEYRSDSDEAIRLMWPEFLPAFIGLSEEHALEDTGGIVEVLRSVLPEAIAGGGAGPETPVQRAVRQVERVVRDARFAKSVKDAYGGRCALCGLDYGLVEAAHILPVAAPGASDRVDNGLCLCPNHHRAFDRHLLCFEPATLDVRIHPALTQQNAGPGRALFVESTRDRLLVPDDHLSRPSSANLRARYEFFEREYRWADL